MEPGPVAPTHSPTDELALPQLRLRQIEDAADALLGTVVPPNTRRAFDQDWATWREFCGGENIDPHTVSAGLLVAFVTWLAHSRPGSPAQAPATIVRRLAGVLDGWKQAKLDIPHGITADARRIVKAYEKNLNRENIPTGRGSAPALTIRDLRRIIEACPNTVAGIRDKALIVIGFGVAARRSELAALLVSDVKRDPNGLIVTIRDSKTGGRVPVLPPGTDIKTCPVRNWQAWLETSRITEGPAFRRVTRHDRVLGRGMDGASIGAIVTRAGERAALEVRLTGHSMRSGLATEARRAGHDAKTIAQQGGWKANSATLYGYMQIVDRWTDNALKGIGL